MAYGVTLAGFVIKRLAVIKDEMEGEFREVFGVGIDLSAESPFGQLIGIFAERESLLWELAEDVYDSAYPDTAEGTSLDNVGALTASKRKGNTFSKVNAILFGVEGTVIPEFRKASVDGNPSAIFLTDSEVVIGAAIAEVQRVVFAFGPPDAGDFVLTFDGESTDPLPFDATATDVQAALRALPTVSDDLTVTGDTNSFFNITFAGDMAGVNHPLIGTSDDLEDSSGDPLFVYSLQQTQGQPAQVAASMTAETAGSTQAPAGSLTVIDTPVTGWTGLTNPLSAVIGNTRENDPEYRMRRAQTTQKAGSGSVPAITSDLLNINGVTHVRVFENRTMATNDDGLPPKSLRAVVLGGPDELIAETIWQDKPAGIETDGNTTIEVTDSQGYPREIQFHRPDQIDIWVRVTISVDAEIFPLDGEDQIMAALLALGSEYGVGADPVAEPYLMSALAQFPGILEAQVEISDDGVAYGNRIELDPFQIANFDILNMEVIVS